MLVGTLEPRMRQWREYNAEGWPRQQDRRISPLVPRRADAPPPVGFYYYINQTGWRQRMAQKPSFSLHLGRSGAVTDGNGWRGGDAPPRRPSDVLGVLWGRLRAVSGALEALVGKRKQRAGS